MIVWSIDYPCRPPPRPRYSNTGLMSTRMSTKSYNPILAVHYDIRTTNLNDCLKPSVFRPQWAHYSWTRNEQVKISVALQYSTSTPMTDETMVEDQVSEPIPTIHSLPWESQFLRWQCIITLPAPLDRGDTNSSLRSPYPPYPKTQCKLESTHFAPEALSFVWTPAWLTPWIQGSIAVLYSAQRAMLW